MIPDLQCSIVCDDVRQEHNGKFMMIGIFDTLRLPKLPAGPFRLCIVNRWCCGEGVFKQKTRIVAPDGTTLVSEGREVEIKLASQEQSIATSVEVFVNPVFKERGLHWVEVLLEGTLRLRYPLKILVGEEGK